MAFPLARRIGPTLSDYGFVRQHSPAERLIRLLHLSGLGPIHLESMLSAETYIKTYKQLSFLIAPGPCPFAEPQELCSDI
jgi:hypothetical protein